MERLECCGNCAHYNACNNIMKRYTDFGELNKDGAACGYYAVRLDEILGGDYNLDRLRELVKADKEKKIFISPCKIGDTVYILYNGKYPHLNSATVSGVHLRDETYRGGKKRREYIVVRNNGFSKHLPFDKIGKMWFLDESAAKATLAKEANQ